MKVIVISVRGSFPLDRAKSFVKGRFPGYEYSGTKTDFRDDVTEYEFEKGGFSNADAKREIVSPTKDEMDESTKPKGGFKQ